MKDSKAMVHLQYR